MSTECKRKLQEYIDTKYIISLVPSPSATTPSSPQWLSTPQIQL